MIWKLLRLVKLQVLWGSCDFWENPKAAEEIEKTIRSQAAAIRESLDGNPVIKEKDSENKLIDKKEISEDKKETVENKKNSTDIDKK